MADHGECSKTSPDKNPSKNTKEATKRVDKPVKKSQIGSSKGSKKGSVMNELENVEDHGCPKVQDIIDEEIWICSSYLFRHKTTLHCEESKAKSFVNWIRLHLIL